MFLRFSLAHERGIGEDRVKVEGSPQAMAPRDSSRPRCKTRGGSTASRRDARKRQAQRRRRELSWQRKLALEIIRTWQSPRTAANIAAVEELVRVPAALMETLADHAPRSWICTGTRPRPAKPRPAVVIETQQAGCEPLRLRRTT